MADPPEDDGARPPACLSFVSAATAGMQHPLVFVGEEAHAFAVFAARCRPGVQRRVCADASLRDSCRRPSGDPEPFTCVAERVVAGLFAQLGPAAKAQLATQSLPPAPSPSLVNVNPSLDVAAHGLERTDGGAASADEAKGGTPSADVIDGLPVIQGVELGPLECMPLPVARARAWRGPRDKRREARPDRPTEAMREAGAPTAARAGSSLGDKDRASGGTAPAAVPRRPPDKGPLRARARTVAPARRLAVPSAFKIFRDGTPLCLCKASLAHEPIASPLVPPSLPPTENKAQALRENPNSNDRGVTALLQWRWRRLSDEDRAKYVQLEAEAEAAAAAVGPAKPGPKKGTKRKLSTTPKAQPGELRCASAWLRGRRAHGAGADALRSTRPRVRRPVGGAPESPLDLDDDNGSGGGGDGGASRPPRGPSEDSAREPLPPSRAAAPAAAPAVVKKQRRKPGPKPKAAAGPKSKAAASKVGPKQPPARGGSGRGRGRGRTGEGRRGRGWARGLDTSTGRSPAPAAGTAGAAAGEAIGALPPEAAAGAFQAPAPDAWQSHGSTSLTMMQPTMVQRLPQMVPGVSPMPPGVAQPWAPPGAPRDACPPQGPPSTPGP